MGNRPPRPWTGAEWCRAWIELYGRRWEHEICYKKLKINLRGGSVLHSHRPETSAQEVAALLIACSLIAQERSEIAAPATFNR